jgi:hypothetical protein
VGNDRHDLERRWLHLTRELLPKEASAAAWPVSEYHCFQRILLDAVCEGVWYDHVPARPAYRHLETAKLAEAVALAERVLAGEADLAALNARSLAWRRARSSTTR